VFREVFLAIYTQSNILEYTSLLGRYSFNRKLPRAPRQPPSVVLLYFISEFSLFLLRRLIYMSLQSFFRDSEGMPLDETYMLGPVKCGHAT
jgi:hypothetical protein